MAAPHFGRDMCTDERSYLPHCSSRAPSVSAKISAGTSGSMHTNKTDRDLDRCGRLLDESTESEGDDIKAGLQTDGRMLARWRQFGRSHGLTTDAQIASFLLDQYAEIARDVVKSTPPHCARCGAPLMLVCVKCHLRSQPGNDASTGILCTPPSSIVRKQYTDSTRQYCDGTGDNHQPPVFIPTDTEKTFSELLPDVKQESESECSHSVESRDSMTNVDINLLSRRAPATQLRGGRCTAKRVNPFGSTVSSTQLSGGHGAAKGAKKSASGSPGSTLSSTQISPLSLTAPTAQLRGGLCEANRVDGGQNGAKLTKKMVNVGSSATETNSHKATRSLHCRQSVRVANSGQNGPKKISKEQTQHSDRGQHECTVNSDTSQHGEQNVNDTASNVCMSVPTVDTDSADPLELSDTSAGPDNVNPGTPTALSAHLSRGYCGDKPLNPLSPTAPSTQLSESCCGVERVKDESKILGKNVNSLANKEFSSRPRKKRGPRPKPRQVHPCPQCDKEFPTGSRLREHMKCHTGREKPYKCPHCEKGCVSKSQLAIHIRSHTGDKPFACDDCDKSYCTKAALIAHVRCHTGERPFVCEQCGASFRRKENLKFHSRLHTGARPFVCPQCGWAFALRENLYRHRLTHTGAKPYSCKECDSTFTSRYGLKQHGMIHANQKPVSCTMCEAKFRTKSQLKKHLVTHTGVKPFRCTECDAAFAFNKALNLHMRTHTGEKPFSCEQCEYRCARASTLAVHRRKHTGEKPYVCKVCGLAFRLSEERTVHMDMVHTGERKHICHECGVAYFRHQYLTDHKRRKHTQKEPA